MYNFLNSITANPIMQTATRCYNSLPNWEDLKKYLPAMKKVKAVGILVLVASARSFGGAAAAAPLNNRISPSFSGPLVNFTASNFTSSNYPLPYCEIVSIPSDLQSTDDVASYSEVVNTTASDLNSTGVAAPSYDEMVNATSSHLTSTYYSPSYYELDTPQENDASQLEKALAITEIDISITFTKLPLKLQSDLQVTSTIPLIGRTYMNLSRLYYEEGLSENYKQQENEQAKKLTIALLQKGFTTDEIITIFQNMKGIQSKNLFLERISGVICHTYQPTANELITFTLERYFWHLENDLEIEIPEEIRNINKWKFRLNNIGKHSSFKDAIFELIQLENKYHKESSTGIENLMCEKFFSTYDQLFANILYTSDLLDAFERREFDAVSLATYIHSVFRQLQMILRSVDCYIRYFNEKAPEKVNKIIDLEQDLIDLKLDFFMTVVNGCSKQSNQDRLPDDFLIKLERARKGIDNLASPNLEYLTDEFIKYSTGKVDLTLYEPRSTASLSLQFTVVLLGFGAVLFALCTRKPKTAEEIVKKPVPKKVVSKASAKKASVVKVTPAAKVNAGHSETPVIIVSDERKREEKIEPTSFRIPTKTEDAVLGSESKYRKPSITLNLKELAKQNRKLKKRALLNNNKNEFNKRPYVEDYSPPIIEEIEETPTVASSTSSSSTNPLEGKPDTRHLDREYIALRKNTETKDEAEIEKKKGEIIIFEMEKDQELMRERLTIAQLAASNIEEIYTKYLSGKAEADNLVDKQEKVHLALLYHFLRLFEALNPPDLSPNGRKFIGNKLFDLKDNALCRHEIRHRGYTIKPDDCFKFAEHFCSLKLSKRINAQETGFIDKKAVNINYNLLKSNFDLELRSIYAPKYLNLIKKIAKELGKSNESDDPQSKIYEGILLAAVKMCLVILRECLPLEEKSEDLTALGLIKLTNKISHSMKSAENQSQDEIPKEFHEIIVKEVLELASHIDDLSVG